MRRSRRFASLGVLAIMLVSAACSPKTEPVAEPSSSAPVVDDTPVDQGDENASLTIMEFNIEYGGDGVDFASVPKAIVESGADVVMVEEAFGAIPKIAEELGWDYVDNAHQLVSKVPIFPSPDDPRVAYIEIAPGKMAAITNVHLSSTGYGPNVMARKDYTVKQALANESQRIKEMTPIVASMSTVAAEGVPSFIVGDLNSASHFDYIEEAVGLRPQITAPVEWPVTVMVEDAGFEDSYRVLHPDPVEDPGLTWPAWRPKVKGWNPQKGFTLEDRIDYIFSAGPATPVDSFIMGEEGGPVDKFVTPWPTDHRALISTFDIDLTQVAPAPNLVSFPEQVVEVGEPIPVSYSGVGAAAIAAVPAEGAEGATSSTPVTEASGTAELDTAGLEAAPYEVQLQGEDGSVLTSAPVWFLEPGAGPTVQTLKPVYKVGEPIKVSWYGAPANRWDWIGTYERNDTPGAYIQYEYTEATVAGETTVSGGSPGSWPLPPGKYSVYLLIDDGYKVLAKNVFSVKG